MSILRLVQQPTRIYAIWHIRETEDELRSLIDNVDIPPSLTHPQKRLEFLASRLLTQLLMHEAGGRYNGIIKNEFGKPFLKDSTWHVSQSHSFPYVAVIIDQQKNTGIDIEQLKENLHRVAPRVFNNHELANANDNLTYLCVLWCVKEALIKVYGKKDLTLKEEIEVESFELDTEGTLKACIRKNNTESFYTLEYQVGSDFAMAYTL